MLLPDNKKNFFPLRFGAPSIISNDANFDKMKFIDMKFKSWLKSSLSDFLPEKPKSEIGILAQTFNPLFIHQYNEKWYKGKGLSIYRHLCKYFIDWCLCLLVGTVAVYRCQKNRVEGFGMLQIAMIEWSQRNKNAYSM
jgi:hypothetical protein